MRFAYTGTEEKTVQKCYLMPGKRFVGFGLRSSEGFRFRRSPTEPWSSPTTRKHEAGAALVSRIGVFDTAPD